MQYSFAKGLKKGLLAVIVFAGALLAIQFPELNDMSLVDFISSNLKNLIGGLTVGGVITMIINYLKVKLS